MRSRSRTRPDPVSSSRVDVKCRDVAATTVGCGSTSRSPATSSVQDACDSGVRAPGRVTVAAAVRTRSRAPGSTTTRMLIASPPSGVAAADTRCTVSSVGPPPRDGAPALDARLTVAAGDDEDVGPHCTGTRSCSRTQASTAVAAGSSVNEISTVGRCVRTLAASRRITSRSAPTSGARSVLLMTNRSE